MTSGSVAQESPSDEAGLRLQIRDQDTDSDQEHNNTCSEVEATQNERVSSNHHHYRRQRSIRTSTPNPSLSHKVAAILIIAALSIFIFLTPAGHKKRGLPDLLIDADASKERRPRIVNGIPADKETDPQSSVLIFTVKGTPQYRKTRCTGTLLDERTIITAAHCFDTFVKLEVYVGLYSWDDFRLDSDNHAQIFHIKKQTSVHHHPEWQGNVNFGFDVAILQLENGDKVIFNEYVKPAKLEARPVPINALLLSLGYGNLNKDMGNQTNKLMKSYVVHRPTDNCLNIMKEFPSDFPDDDPDTFEFVKNSLCLERYNPQNAKKDRPGQPCNGDSGGPIYTQDASGSYAVAGTLSWGTPASCTLFTVYESTLFNKKWLEQFGSYFNYY